MAASTAARPTAPRPSSLRSSPTAVATLASCSMRTATPSPPTTTTLGVCPRERAPTPLASGRPRLADQLTLAGEIASEQALRYAGYVYDPESGLYYCSARYYDPATRQWTTADSAKADGEESAYQYGRAEPVECTDRTGLEVVAGSGGGALVDDTKNYVTEQMWTIGVGITVPSIEFYTYYTDYDANWWQIIKFKYKIDNEWDWGGADTSEQYPSRLRSITVESVTNGAGSAAWTASSQTTHNEAFHSRASGVYHDIAPVHPVYGHKKMGNRCYTFVIVDWAVDDILHYENFEVKSTKF